MAAALVVAASALASTSFATLADFEDLSLSPNSYHKLGSFTSGGASFNNVIDPTYGSWAGWAYSNVNDTTTPGLGNEFAAYSGTGVGGAGNYGIGYIDLFGGTQPTITIPDGMKVQSAMFTNTTYAALSMLNGDAFAKQFTSTDWFKLTISGEDASNNAVGSVDFYLAQNGSIVSDWQTVDLSPLSAAKTLTFGLTSSDNSYGFMNTPSYFAMDNMQMTAVPEPSTLVFVAVGGLAILFCRWRRRAK
jgi:hypothetical protein